MPNPTQRAQKAISALAKKHGIALNKDSTQLADRQIAITTLYAGGSSLSRLINEDCSLHFAQCSSEGPFVAILPAEDLMRLLETESIYNQLQEKKLFMNDTPESLKDARR
jgi:hypothetical protein